MTAGTSQEIAGEPFEQNIEPIGAIRREPRAADIVRWIERLHVPEGVKLCQPFKFAEFQVDVLRGIYDSPHPIRRVILSKSTICALIVLTHLVGLKVIGDSPMIRIPQ